MSLLIKVEPTRYWSFFASAQHRCVGRLSLLKSGWQLKQPLEFRNLEVNSTPPEWRCMDSLRSLLTNNSLSTPMSRKVAVTLPEFSFCFSKNVLTQSCSLSLGEMVPDMAGGGAPPPPFQLHPSAPQGQPFENTVNIGVFSSSSPQQ